jgi:hypothetical protein
MLKYILIFYLTKSEYIINTVYKSFLLNDFKIRDKSVIKSCLFENIL